MATWNLAESKSASMYNETQVWERHLYSYSEITNWPKIISLKITLYMWIDLNFPENLAKKMREQMGNVNVKSRYGWIKHVPSDHIKADCWGQAVN